MLVSPSRCVALVGVALVLGAPFLRAEQASTVDTPRQDWRRVRSETFVAVGNASDADMRAALQEIETFRRALSSFGLPHLEPAASPAIIVFKDDAALAPFRPRDDAGRLRQNAVGFFISQPDATYLVLSGRPRGDRGMMFRVTLHEYAHDVLLATFPAIPLWLNEGLAEFYASVSIDNAPGISVIGAPLPERMSVLATRPLLPLEGLVNPIQATDYVSNSTTSSVFYAQSWALVHYLLIGGGAERSNQIEGYLEALTRGRSPDDAFTEAFGDMDVLQRDLARYVNRGRFEARPLPRTTQSAEVTIGPSEPLLESEVAATEGDLLVRVRAFGAAEGRLQRALALAPSSATARLALALLRIEQSRFEEAIALLGPLAAERPDWRFGHLYLSSALRRAGRYDEAFVEYQKGQIGK